MNTNVAKMTAHAFATNFRDLRGEATTSHLPEGLTDLLVKVREFAMQAGELDKNRPDSDTAFHQEEMGKVWFHAQKALVDAQIVKATHTGIRDMSLKADSDRERRDRAIWNITWIEAILTETVKNS